MKYVTIRLLVDDNRASKIERALETTAAGSGYLGITIDPDILHGFEVENTADVDETSTPGGGS